MSKLQRTAALSSSLIAVTLFFSAAYVASAATDTWSSSPSSANWNTANWTGGNNPPVAGDALAFGSSSTTTLNNDFAAGTAFDGIYFNGASAFILNGNNVLISGAASNTVGVMNTSGSSQTLGTLSLTLDWGNYTFSSSGSLALNGGLTVNTGGIAIFDGNETSTSLTADASGLISDLGGAGLTYSGGSAFTGLATISGGSISTYSSFGSVVAAPGSIGTATAAGAQNIELTATTAGNYTLANNPGITYANTISVSSATSTALVVGSTAGAQTLDVGAVSGIGGFYVVPSVTAQVLTIGSGSSTILTSGPETGPATPSAIVFAINGPGVGVNSAEINCSIQDNGSGGRVSLVKTGPGSMFFNGALTTFASNTFSGSIYVDQGQFQSGNPGCFGTNSIYVGVGGTVYFNNTITNTNNIYLSPGNGAGTGAVVAGGAGLVEGGTGTSIYGGTITLQGAAVSSFPAGTISTPTGDTFSGNGTGATVNFTNQITGTGTFELTGAHSFTAVFKNTSANANNWQGGMIIGGHSAVAVNEAVKMGATNQIPNGPGTGDISFNPANSSGNAYSILDLNSFNTTVNALVGTAPNCGYGAIITNSSATPCTLTIGANNHSATYGGDLGDGGSAKALSLIKIGTGSQTIGGNVSNFHGNITVSAGTLAFTGGGNTNNPANAPSFTVAAGGVLDVSGLSGGGFSFGPTQTINCTGQINGSDTIGGTFDTFLGTIGTFTNNGTLTLSGGSSYVWNVNNFTGTAGSDPGWSEVNVQGALPITATSGSPINLNITSLSGDAPGSAANFNGRVSGSWIIATATGGITGFTGPSQFSINTSSFSNLPASAPKWSVSLTNGGNALALNYTSVSVIGVGLTDQTNNVGTTANYSVTASVSGTTPPVSFQWLQGVNVLVNGGTSAGGGTVTITTNSLTSTLSIANVQDADAGGITVNVTDSASDSGSSSATLTVIDPPTGASITQAGGNSIAGGNLANLQATAATGTMPFTYTWYLNGVAITNSSSVSGVGTSNLTVRLLPSQDGVYTVVIANSAGSSSNSFTLGPVTSVLGQVVFEPFTSYVAQPAGGNNSFDTWEGMTNLYNQLTGSPAWWFHSSGSGIQMVVSPNDLNNGIQNQQGGNYPWPGLAGNSSNMLYWTSSLNSHLEFGQTEGFPPGTKVYASFIMSLVSPGSANGVTDVLAGFTSSDSGTAFNLKLCSVVTNFSANQIALGIAKGTGPNAQTVDANTLWTGPIDLQQDMLIVLCYTVVSGGSTATDDTVSMWINPNPTNFYTGEANVPPPDLGPASFGLTNSVIRDFAVHATAAPGSHRITDLRIGTTWASVTPPSAPTLSLGNVYAPVGTTATLTSADAGNPVLNYGWQHNGGAALTDGSTGHGSTISGSGTYSLTIANVQPADYGLYTVNGTNIDLSPANSPTNLTGAASALLTGQPPSLSATRSGANVIIAWPTNWVSYVLQQTPSVSPTSWTTNSLSPYPVIGTNNAVTVPVTGGTQEYYRLSNH